MVDYQFYTDTYCGSFITAGDWPQLEARAAQQLDYYRRVYIVADAPQEIESKAICAMAETLAFFEQAQSAGGAVSSASIGSVSVSYGGLQGMDFSFSGQAKELYRAACLYLDIYRGVCV